MTLDSASVDGRRDYWLHFAPLRARDGELVGAIMVAQDITERVRARAQIEARLTQQSMVGALGSRALHGASAVGKTLIELPLMRRQLLKLMLPTEAARSIMLYAAAELEKADAGDEEARKRVRILTPLLKFRACRDARKVTGDAKLKSEGAADKAAGKVQNAVGGVKDAVRDATDN